ncbi:hypothetical protein C8Q72DRAFT_883918 [Fomitopsis betulina]|nr:hypothetical protein C8Q72DRAFT_883918 [Fomitopsis betulina]
MAAQGSVSLTPAEANAAESFLLFYYYFENSLYWSATTLCCYDWFLTLDREVESIWKTEQSLVTILFYGIRYPAILNTVIELLTRISWPSWQSNFRCGFSSQELSRCINYLSQLLFASLRIYAVFNRNIWIASIVLLLGILNPVLTTYVFMHSVPVLDGFMEYQVCTLALSPGDREAVYSLYRLLCVFNVLGLATGHLTLTIRGIFCDCEFIEAWQFWTAILNSVLLSRLTLDIRDTSRPEDRSLPTSGLLSTSTSPDGETTEEAIELDTEVSLWANSPSTSTERNTEVPKTDPPG